ncbi:MAG: helix-turn-helix transcriptional regulator, partial [Rhodobacterales bacterium]|nr:helix-turn-helix transcriptional regulator [Rhodobacterales bacterium]
MMGAELKVIRRAQGISQTCMAALIGCSRHAVSYWECKGGEINTRWGVPAQMLEALGVAAVPIK